jgi:hypothetical protein
LQIIQLRLKLSENTNNSYVGEEKEEPKGQDIIGGGWCEAEYGKIPRRPCQERCR